MVRLLQLVSIVLKLRLKPRQSNNRGSDLYYVMPPLGHQIGKKINGYRNIAGRMLAMVTFNLSRRVMFITKDTKIMLIMTISL